MRKVVVYELLFLYGVAEDPDAFVTDSDDVTQANLATVIAAQDAVILGRRSQTSGPSSGRAALSSPLRRSSTNGCGQHNILR